jgi:hypothetical protein
LGEEEEVKAEDIIRDIEETMRKFPPPPPDPFAFNPAQPFGGMRVIQSDNLPREQIGRWIKARHAPRWFAFILRLLGISHVVWISWPMYSEPKSYAYGNTLICPPSTWTALRNHPGILSVTTAS